MSKNISHVILLLLENRSFDHVLGSLKRTYPALDGIDPAAPARNIYQGSDYLQSAGASRYLNFDPRHEYEHVIVQLSDRNSGFVQDFSQSYPTAAPSDRAEVMNYHA